MTDPTHLRVPAKSFPYVEGQCPDCGTQIRRAEPPAELANLVQLVRRIVATPDGQPLLLLDRLNDLDVALGEYDRRP